MSEQPKEYTLKELGELARQLSRWNEALRSVRP